MTQTKMEAFGQIADRAMTVAERVFDRLRPNVIIIAGAVTFLIHDFGDKLILELKAADVPPEVLLTALTGLIFTGIGGLIACMMRMFESPSVPADTFERMVTVRVRGEIEDGAIYKARYIAEPKDE